MIKKNNKKIKQSRNHYFSNGRSYRTGGTVINIITAVIFFGLIVFGVMWVMKQTGEQVEQYSQGMVTAQNKATTTSCQLNLKSIYTNLQMYAIENNQFPDSLEEIVSWSGDSRLYKCPDPDGQEYIYIPGQRLNSPGSNIIMYESEPVHNGGCNVLRVNGAIDLISPEELEIAIRETKAHLR
jgi:hypothetical protein